MLFVGELESLWVDLLDGKDEIVELVEVFRPVLVVRDCVGLDKRPLISNGRPRKRSFRGVGTVPIDNSLASAVDSSLGGGAK
jgi:hypothetical protein